MHPRFASLAEKIMVRLLVASFALPLALGGLLLIPPLRTLAPAWLLNRTLSGVQVQPEPEPLSRSSVFSTKFQEHFARRYSVNFVGREMMIRGIDELYLRVFHATASGVVVGRNLSLFETVYPEEYCLRRADPRALLPLVDNLRRMQDFCEARGVAFALVITPSKAAVYPEDLPARWRALHKPAPRGYDLLLPLLRQRNIRYVDGHQLAVDLKTSATVPVFPLGGTHWGDPAALATTNALLEVLAHQRLGVEPIRHFSTSQSNHPEGQDRDLANLINTVFPWHYPVVNVEVPPLARPGTYRPNLVCIGGSFARRMLDFLAASRQFSELEFYFYYRHSKLCWADGEAREIGAPTPPIHFETDVFAADSLVLECNEQTLHAPADHLAAFLRDALAELPDPQAPKAAFHYESQLQYRWGDSLSFGSGEHAINLAATTGFTTPDAAGSRTVGPVAALHFSAPPPASDIRLEVEAQAYYIGARLPEQRVAVCVNGREAGEWTWLDTVPARREVVVPREWVSGGEVRLEFRVAHPVSPSELGWGRDARKYGISVASLRTVLLPPSP